MSDEAEKRRPGRPTNAELEARHPKHKMKAKPNWEEIDPDDMVDNPDRLGISPDLVPDGMSLQWVTDSVYGQDMSQHRAHFEKRGWTPVHQSDFDGVFDGMFMPKGVDGEIKVDGLVLMARPKELTDKARKLDFRRAREQVAIKEAALTGGDLPGVTLDTAGPAERGRNAIKKTVERIEIPRD